MQAKGNDTMTIKDIDCYVLDMDGTIYLGEQVIPGAKELLSFFDEKAIRYCFFTNNSSKSPEDYNQKLKRLRLSEHPSVITSGDVTADYLIRTFGPAPRVYAVGTDALIKHLTAAGVICENTGIPDCLVVAFDTTFDYSKATRAVELLREGVPFIATNVDVVCPLDGGKVLPDCSSICAMLTHATGCQPKFLGKPFAETADYIKRAVNLPADKIAVIGDRLYTDIELALNNGMCAIGVLSGEMTQEDIDRSDKKPHYLFDSVADLCRLLKEQIK